MATEAPPGELSDIEREALEHLSEEGLPPTEEGPEEPGPPRARLPVVRIALVVCFAIFATAAMTGGVFVGFSARIWGSVAGVLGVVLAVGVVRIRRPIYVYIAFAIGIFVIGLLLVTPTGFSNVVDLGSLVRRSIVSGDAQRPPVVFDPGWRALMGWLMGAIGFVGGWIALEMRRPALSLLLPLPVIGFTAISVPESDQIFTGLATLLLFAIGLGVLSGVEMAGDEQAPSIGFEIRRGIRALPMLAAIGALVYGLSQLNVLFPTPLIDPTQEARRPRTVPLSEVEDRVLFRVESNITGPWRIGHLDVYDGADWRLPPFAASRLEEVARSGVVDSELTPGVRARFEIAEIGGSVLPGLPNMVGIVAEGPKLAFDERLGNIRLTQGSIESGLSYTVVAATIPTIENLQQVNQPIPEEARDFMEIPNPPPAVARLLAEAPQTSTWDRMNYLRETLLNTVVSSGQGSPVSVPPSKVQDMLAGSRRGTPFEIVAAQAMLARWAGVPSRIAYGYDGGEEVGESLEVRPKHGSSYLEVYFPTYKWVPVIGTPLQAESSLSNNPQQFNPNVEASNDLAVRLQVPVALSSRILLFAQIRRILSIVVPLILLGLALYYSWPGLWKAFVRSRRRASAADLGPGARIVVAYAEWRDTATDFGYRYDADTPLMFLDRVIEDEEHTELAWLATRTLWGDLRDQISDDDALAAEELSRSLRRRLSEGHPYTLRLVAGLSRLSLRHPYAPVLVSRAERKKERDEAPAAA